jgi:hypothetical protein
MAQHDYNIANQTAANARTDINDVLSAIATNNSGSSAPSATFSNMWWYDTNNSTLKIRADGNDAWISVAYLDQTDDEFRILDDTIVVNIFGSQIGRLGDQATSLWETGTGTTETLVSPAKVAASATEVVGNYALGVGQTWQDMTSSRAFNTTYQNTTGRPIFIGISATVVNGKTLSLLVSPNSDMSASVTIDRTFDVNGATGINGIIPNNIYYSTSVATTPSGLVWAELR